MKKIVEGHNDEVMEKITIYYLRIYREKLLLTVKEVETYLEVITDNKIYIVPEDEMMDVLKHQYTSKFILERIIWILYEGLKVNFNRLKNGILEENKILKTIEPIQMKNYKNNIAKDKGEVLCILKKLQERLFEYLNYIDNTIDNISIKASVNEPYVIQSVLNKIHDDIKEIFDFVNNYFNEYQCN